MTARRTIEAANADIAKTNFIVAVVLIVLGGLAALYIGPATLKKDPVPLAFIPLAFVFFAVFYLGSAILNGLRVAKSGKSLMDIDEAVFGQGVRGTIRTTRPIEPTGDYLLHLECIEHVQIRVPTKQGTTRSEDRRFVRWETRQSVKREGISSTAGIPVDIKVDPFQLPKVPNSEGIHWELTIKAPLRGLNYSAVFGVEMHGSPLA